MGGRVNLVILFVMLVLLAPIAGNALAGRIIHVEADSTGDYPTIQAAINVCVNGDVVIAAPGTYTGDGNRDIDFLGKAITLKSENGPENCIIDCGYRDSYW